MQRLESKELAIAVACAKTPRLLYVGLEFSPETDARQHLVGTFSQFYEAVAKMQPLERRFHEHIWQDGAPIKLFWDFETSDLSVSRDRVLQVIERIRAHVVDVFAKAGAPASRLSRHILLDGSRPDKHSFHLVFPYLVLENMHAVEFVVSSVVEDLGEPLLVTRREGDEEKKGLVDFQVYSRAGTLRTAYSAGFGKLGYALNPFPTPSRTKVRRINPDVLKCSMVTQCAGQTPLDHVAAFGPKRFSLFASKLPLRRSFSAGKEGGGKVLDHPVLGWAPTELNEMTSRFCDLLRRKGYKVIAPQTPYHRSGYEYVTISCTLKGVVCKRKGDRHKHNNAYAHATLFPRPSKPGFIVQEKTPVEFVCTDEDCGGAHWRAGVDAGTALYGPLNDQVTRAWSSAGPQKKEREAPAPPPALSKAQR